jgi:very-short-patch-repair endonuclease
MDRHDPWRTALARRLRREATDAERRLWSQLRRSPEAHWRKQHPILGFIVDFYSASAALGVELDGGQHFTPTGQELDRRRDQELASIGIRILRYDDATVLERTREVSDEIWGVWSERAAGRTR